MQRVVLRHSKLLCNVLKHSLNQMLKRTAALQQSTPSQQLSYTLLTPVIGPEFITGSTRMKGGSATLMFSHVHYIMHSMPHYIIRRTHPQQ